MISTFELKNWWFSKEQNNKESWYNIHGNCFNNPKFGRGLYVHIAKINKIEISSDGLIVHNAEGSYFCKYELAMEQEYEFMSCKELFEEYDINKLLKVQDAMECGKEKRMSSEVTRASIEDEENCLILCFSDESIYYSNKAVLKSRGKEYGLPIVEEDGDFSDYVLIGAEASLKGMPDINRELDFRYFPRCSGRMHFYTWNGYQGKIFAQNTGIRVLRISTPYGDFSLEPNGTFYEIDAESFRGRIVK